MLCSDVKVSCQSFKWWTFILLFLLPFFYCILFIDLWQSNLETKLRLEVRRLCFNVRLLWKCRNAQDCSMWDVFPNCCPTLLQFFVGMFTSTEIITDFLWETKKKIWLSNSKINSWITLIPTMQICFRTIFKIPYPSWERKSSSCLPLSLVVLLTHNGLCAL